MCSYNDKITREKEHLLYRPNNFMEIMFFFTYFYYLCKQF